EESIRYFHVTGVQTCALPISHDPLGNRLAGHQDPDQRGGGVTMFNIYGEYDPRTMYGVDWLPLGNEKPRRVSPQPKANPEPQEEIGRGSYRETVNIASASLHV